MDNRRDAVKAYFESTPILSSLVKQMYVFVAVGLGLGIIGGLMELLTYGTPYYVGIVFESIGMWCLLIGVIGALVRKDDIIALAVLGIMAVYDLIDFIVGAVSIYWVPQYATLVDAICFGLLAFLIYQLSDSRAAAREIRRQTQAAILQQNISQMTVFCQNCGSTNPLNSTFCQVCGTRVVTNPQPINDQNVGGVGYQNVQNTAPVQPATPVQPVAPVESVSAASVEQSASVPEQPVATPVDEPASVPEQPVTTSAEQPAPVSEQPVTTPAEQPVAVAEPVPASEQAVDSPATQVTPEQVQAATPVDENGIFCPYCGILNPQGAAFCKSCGGKI